MSKALFIGERKSTTGNGEPLTGNSGKFLAELCGQSHEEFLKDHLCINLFSEDNTLMYNPKTLLFTQDTELIILLGKKVSDKFIGIIPKEYSEFKLYLTQNLYHDIKCIISIPHTSRKNRYWNIKQNVINAKEILQTTLYLFRD